MGKVIRSHDGQFTPDTLLHECVETAESADWCLTCSVFCKFTSVGLTVIHLFVIQVFHYYVCSFYELILIEIFF